MRVPLEWLEEYLNFKKSPEEYQEYLTMRGLEVENIEKYEDTEVINIDLTPNRGDCASMIGIARELSAYFEGKYKEVEVVYSETGDEISKNYSLKIENPEKCPIYYLKYIKDIKLGESPLWMQKRLRACGLRPLNNVIDITNYVMLETGQPLHAFDADVIKGKTVVVRGGKNGEEILALDGYNKQLTTDEIIIADEKDAIAIGGVIGGENSSVTEKTSHILLESAFFAPDSISRTERRLETKTEASYRFSRHVDAQGVEKALDRATHLIEKLCHGKPAPGKLFEGSPVRLDNSISLSVFRVNKVLGTSITKDEIIKYLQALEFNVTQDDDLIVNVPSFRNDITRPIDLIEEIARMYGYDNIEPSMPESKIITDLIKNEDYLERAEDILRYNGYWEAITHTLVSSSRYRDLPVVSGRYKPIEISNPININMDILRINLLFSLIEVCRYNIHQKQSPIRFYERGTVFIEEEGSYSETDQIAFICMSEDFFEAKKIITLIFESLHQKFSYIFDYDADIPYFNREKRGKVEVDGKEIAEFGCISEVFLKSNKFTDCNFIGGYINTEFIQKARFINKKFSKWSLYPSVLRDISLVVPASLTHFEIYVKILEVGGKFLKKISLYDIFQDDKFGPDKKSMTYRIEYNSEERTLTAQEADESVEMIVKELLDEFGITLRPE